jgi:phenylacetate-CoA ligase
MSSWTEDFWLLMLDWGKGLTVRRHYDAFLQFFDYSRDEVLHRQRLKLRALLAHAYENVPYYRDLFDQLHARPEDIRTPEDLAKLPVLSRQDVLANYKRLLDRKHSYPVCFKSSSSGTTGTPIRYIHDARGESAGIAAGYCLYTLSGWFFGGKSIHIWGNPESIKRWARWDSRLKCRVTNRFNYPAFLLNDPANFQHLYETILQVQPVFMDGYASSIGSFAQWLTDAGLRLEGIKAVFTTAESLRPQDRETIALAIAPVSDLYGCGELNSIANQPVGEQRYYVMEPHIIAQTIEDEPGVQELALTDLDNYIMPFIRYKPGDTVDGLAEPTDTSRLPFASFGLLTGRTADYIRLPDGKVIHPVTLLGGTFLRRFPEIRRHRVIWDQQKLSFELEAAPGLDMEGVRRAIASALSGYAVEFEVSLEARLLPGANGKYRYIEIIKPQRPCESSLSAEPKPTLH